MEEGGKRKEEVEEEDEGEEEEEEEEKEEKQVEVSKVLDWFFSLAMIQINTKH